MHGESHGIFKCPSPSNSVLFPNTSSWNLFLRLPTHYFFIQSLKRHEKQIHNIPIPSKETIPDETMNPSVSN